MDLTILKNPIVLFVLAGSVLISNVVTYNVAAPAANYCTSKSDNELLEIFRKNEEDLKRALRPVAESSREHSGGLDWKKSMR